MTKKLEDPVQGLIDFVTTVKPFHTKIVEVNVEHEHSEKVNITITDASQLEESVDYSPLDYNLTIFGRDNQLRTHADPFDFNLISPDVDHNFIGSSLATQAVQISNNRLLVAGNQLDLLRVGDTFEAFVFKDISPTTILHVDDVTSTSLIINGDTSWITIGSEYYVFSGTTEFEQLFTVTGKTSISLTPLLTEVFVSETVSTDVIGKYFGLVRDRIHINTASNIFTIGSVDFNKGTLNSWPDVNDFSTYKIGNVPHTVITTVEPIVPQAPYDTLTFSSSDGNEYNGYLRLTPIAVVQMLDNGTFYIGIRVAGDQTALFKSGLQFDIVSGNCLGTYTTMSCLYSAGSTDVYFAERPTLQVSTIVGDLQIHQFGISGYSAISRGLSHNNIECYMMESLVIELDPPYDNILPPSQVVSNVHFSNDTGSSSTDRITNVALQDVDAVLSALLNVDEYIEGSVDGGTTWLSGVNVVGNLITWNGVTLLSGTNTITFRVVNTTTSLYFRSGDTQYTLDTTPPTQTISNVQISNDTGTSNTDLITNVALQTITATLSSVLLTGDVLKGSVNGGTTWISGPIVSGTNISWPGVNLLPGTNDIVFQITDLAGNQTITGTAQYTLDVTPPTQTISNIQLSSDSGTSSSDLVTNVAFQNITATLSSSLLSGEYILGSVDSGSSWIVGPTALGTNVSWLGTILLSGTNYIVFKIVDAAGNETITGTTSYTLDLVPPTQLISNVQISNDDGVSNTDFITTIAVQDITATLSSNLLVTDLLEGSVDSGTTWLSGPIASGTNITWNSATLVSGTNDIVFRITDLAGNSVTSGTTQYLLDTEGVTPTTLFYPFSTVRNIEIPFNPPSYSLSISYVPQDAVMYVPSGFDSSIGFMEYPLPTDHFFVESAISKYKASSILPFRAIFEGIQSAVSSDSTATYYLTFGVANDSLVSACSVRMNADHTVGLALIGVHSGYFSYDTGSVTEATLDIIGQYGGSVVNIPFDDTIGITVNFVSSTEIEFWIGTYLIHTATSIPFDITTCYPYVQISKTASTIPATVTVTL